MDASRLSKLTRRAALAMAAVFLAASCAACTVPAEDAAAAPSESADAPAAASGDAGTALLETDAGTFSFRLAHCAIGATDALAHGPGQDDATGEPAYLDLDFVLDGAPVGGVSVDLGATQQFESSDDTYTFDTEYLVGDYALDFGDDRLELQADFHLDSPQSTARGTLTLNC